MRKLSDGWFTAYAPPISIQNCHSKYYYIIIPKNPTAARVLTEHLIEFEIVYTVLDNIFTISRDSYYLVTGQATPLESYSTVILDHNSDVPGIDRKVFVVPLNKIKF